MRLWLTYEATTGETRGRRDPRRSVRVESADARDGPGRGRARPGSSSPTRTSSRSSPTRPTPCSTRRRSGSSCWDGSPKPCSADSLHTGEIHKPSSMRCCEPSTTDTCWPGASIRRCSGPRADDRRRRVRSLGNRCDLRRDEQRVRDEAGLLPAANRHLRRAAGPGGTATAALTVDLLNDSPTSGFPPYVIGPYKHYSTQPGENVAVVDLYCDVGCALEAPRGRRPVELIPPPSRTATRTSRTTCGRRRATRRPSPRISCLTQAWEGDDGRHVPT